MPKHGKAQAQIYADSLEKREKEKGKILGRIEKMLMKQTPLEDTMGKNLQTIKPQQLAKVTNTTIPQAGQQIKQQQTQNRQVGQNMPQQPKQPQQPPAQRNIQFGPSGADLIPNELKQKIDKFNSLDQLRQTDAAINLDAKNPQDYEMAKYLAQSGSPKVQTMAMNKLSSQDLDTLVQPTNPNPEAVSILARKTQNPSYMRSMTKHASPQVRMNLLKNPNITDLTMSEMYDDNDDQIRNHIVGKSDNQELLHLFISDKNPQIRARLVDKLDHDGLKILLTDPDPHVQAMAKSKLQGRFSKMEKAGDGKKIKRPVFTQQDADRLDTKMTTFVTPQELPKYGYGTPIGSDSIGSSPFNTPSFTNKAVLLKELGNFIKKAEGEIEYQVLGMPQLKAWHDDLLKYIKEKHPDLDVNNPMSKNDSPRHARVLKPFFYVKQMMDEYPHMTPQERGNIRGAVRNGRIEGISFLRPEGPHKLYLNAVVVHPRHADVNDPERQPGIGRGLAGMNFKMGQQSGKPTSFIPDQHATDWWRKYTKNPVNGLITITPPEYEGVLAKLNTPKIENEMDEEFTSYAEPIQKDKIMKEFGAVGDVSVPTYGDTEGQNYKKKIGSALHFKARGIEGVFDVMKSVKFEDINE
jgi:hypothetical protein